MAEDRVRKQEEDYTEQVDAALPPALILATSGKLDEAIESLLPLEKKARVASDNKSTQRILVAIIEMCHGQNNWEKMCEYLVLLSKRRAQLKYAVTGMVRRAMEYLDTTPDQATLLKLIDVIRTITAGKIHVELERARVSLRLAGIKEAQGDIVGAADILHDLQVETYGSMDKKEKVEFILEQMRLALANSDFLRAQIISRKFSVRFFDDKAEDIQALKLKFYDLMIRLSEHEKKYLDLCKHYRAVHDTPCVLADEPRALAALASSVCYVVLAPHNNEQSDLIARLLLEPKLERIDGARGLLEAFTTQELLPWGAMTTRFATLRHGDVFGAEHRWADLRARAVEHNIRVVEKYYNRITLKRLSKLLDLPIEVTEKNLCDQVTSKTIYARIDRVTGVVTFRPPKDPNAVLNDWAHGINSLLNLVDKATHLINKEKMVHRVE